MNYYSTEAGRAKVLKRFSMFDGAGLDLTGCTTYKEALAGAGLDYSAEKVPIYLEGGIEIPDKFAAVKSDDPNVVLGIVGKNYVPISSEEAFAVAEELVERGDMHFEAGGPCLSSSNMADFSRNFLVLRGEDFQVGDDTFNSFVIGNNSFDGTTGVRFSVVTQRLACLNGMVKYLGGKKSQLQIQIRHSRDVNSRVRDAFEIIKEYREEMKDIQKEAELFKGIKFSRTDFENKIIPMVLEAKNLGTKQLQEDEEEKKATRERIEATVSELLQAYNADDVQNYSGNAYRVICALSDYETHSAPFRNTGNGQIYMNRVLKGMLLTTSVAQYIAQMNNIRGI